MGQRNLIDINPKILIWAREETNEQSDVVAHSLDVSPAIYNEWERNGKNIPFVTLKKVAKYFNRQLACFFLPDIPMKSKRPNDHRNLNVFNPNLSRETSLAIRRTNRYKKLLIELNGQSYYEKKYQWLKELAEIFVPAGKIDNESIAKWIRDKIGFSLNDQLKANNNFEVYRVLRNLLEEKLCVLVFQFKMPVDEIQGFCYAEEIPYCIVVNSVHHAPVSKIFTIAHELGHILKHQSSLCYPEKVDENEKIEFECNTFAGNFLIPNSIVTLESTSDSIYQKAKALK